MLLTSCTTQALSTLRIFSFFFSFFLSSLQTKPSKVLNGLCFTEPSLVSFLLVARMKGRRTSAGHHSDGHHSEQEDSEQQGIKAMEDEEREMESLHRSLQGCNK
jgi:hypothetical protein